MRLDEQPRTGHQWDELHAEFCGATAAYDRSVRRARIADGILSIAPVVAGLAFCAYVASFESSEARSIFFAAIAATFGFGVITVGGAFRPVQYLLGERPFAGIDPLDFAPIDTSEYLQVLRACNGSRSVDAFTRSVLRQGRDLTRFELKAILAAAAVEQRARDQLEAEQRHRERQLQGAVVRAELATSEPPSPMARTPRAVSNGE
ncbi:MAG: hypothetical protein QM750_19980 [Rubrivivax sp.]